MPVTYTELPRDVVEITGADKRSFLQGLISQDIEKVTTQNSVYGTLLTPQGKFLHDFLIFQTDDRLLFDCEQGRSTDLVNRLSRFKLRADVSLDPQPETKVYGVFGPGAAKLLNLEPEIGATAHKDLILMSVDPREQNLGCRLLGPSAAIVDLLQGLGIEPVGFDAYDQLRISIGAPDGSRDMDVEKSTLLESNIDTFRGIDWEKGCYMGQELTARTKYRGLVKRRLFPFHIGSTEAKPGDPVFSEDKSVGEVRSSSGNLLLASVRTDAMEDEESQFSVNGENLTPYSDKS